MLDQSSLFQFKDNQEKQTLEINLYLDGEKVAANTQKRTGRFASRN